MSSDQSDVIPHELRTKLAFWLVLIGGFLLLFCGIISSILASSEGPTQSFSRGAFTLLLILGSIGLALMLLTLLPEYMASKRLSKERSSELVTIISVFAMPLILILGDVFETGSGFPPLISTILGLSTQIGIIICFVGGLIAFFSQRTPTKEAITTKWIRVVAGIIVGVIVNIVFVLVLPVFLPPGIGEFVILFVVLGALIAYWIAEGSRVVRVASAVVTFALTLLCFFALLFFTSSPGGPQLDTACIGQPGFSCNGLVINQSGVLSLTLGQGLGYGIYDTKFACVSAANALPSDRLNYLSVSNGTLNSGESFSITNLQCYPAIGSINSMLSPIGSSFTGAIWMQYKLASNSTVQFAKVATISVKSSS